MVNWESQRGVIDQAISRATGTEAHTEGRIGLRLLPSPRIRVDRLRLGPERADSPALTADFVWSELALTPLLRGEVRFLDTRIGRADFRIPAGEDGTWRLSPEMFSGSSDTSNWSIENLAIAQLFLTTQVAATG